MPIQLITGPAASGKTGEVLDRLQESIEFEPVLVVPTTGDVRTYEEELLARARVPVGARVVTFGGLVRLATAAGGVVCPPSLLPAQRRALMATAVRETNLHVLKRSSRGHGFVGALDQFVDGVQAARVGPAEFRERLAAAAGGRSRYLAELADLFEDYVRRRDALGWGDGPQIMERAIDAVEAGALGQRPLMVHGFDDLTPQQLALVKAQAGRSVVVVSAVHEPGRACLEARDSFVGSILGLADIGIDVSHFSLEPRATTGALVHLERSFTTDDPASVAPAGQVMCLDAAGVRAEVESVAAEVAALLRSGVSPRLIGVIARSPRSVASLVRDVFDSYAIPVAAETEERFLATPTGRAIGALVRLALGLGDAADVVLFLRHPGRAWRDRVDDLERWVRVESVETADAAVERYIERGGRALWELDALRQARAAGIPDFLDALARVIRNTVEYLHDRRAAVLDEPARRLAMAGEDVADELVGLAEVVRLDSGLIGDDDALLSLLDEMTVRAKAPPGGAGRVELLSPYGVRARQFSHVFLICLQEGEFPRHRTDDPFLSEAERAKVGLPARSDPKAEERYLFYVALSRATDRLYLSYRTSDEAGKQLVPSFFIDDIRELLDPAPAVRTRGLSDTVFAPADVPSVHELGRALALARKTAPPAWLGASERLVQTLREHLGPAIGRADHRPGSLTVAEVLGELDERRRFGASSLEEYVSCPFRYFVGHELRPDELSPKADALARGSLVHDVLERVYRESYLGTRPTPSDVDDAVALSGRILAELAPGFGVDPSTPRGRAVFRRLESDIARYLRWDAEHPIGERVVAVEGGFGRDDDDDARPALDLGEIGIHGKIDRIDQLADGTGLIRDYKSGARVPSRKGIADEGRLQLQLYMLAVRELWGIEPAGGIYHALGSQDPAKKPRGILRGPRADADFDESFLTGNDFTSDATEFEDTLGKATDDAVKVAIDIRRGHLARAPRDGKCPRFCNYHSICRRERGEKNPEEDEDRKKGWDADDQ